MQIDKNNFVNIYSKWLNAVKESISVDWDKAKSFGIIDADFYLADLLSENNLTLKEKLYVILKEDHYELDRKIDDMGLASSKEAYFYDKQKAHNEFWKRYQRPPKSEYWDYIIERRDLLVPQDIRERKGSFFTPQIWVEKSQEYIAEALGENWQDEYYIWDCAAGTGNLLAGLTNKYNIWASTLDKADVEIMIPDRLIVVEAQNDRPGATGGNLDVGSFHRFHRGGQAGAQERFRLRPGGRVLRFPLYARLGGHDDREWPIQENHRDRRGQDVIVGRLYRPCHLRALR